MATFSQHINGAIIASGVLIIPIHSAGLLDINHSLLALSLGILGGVLPDLDSDNSRPVQIAFKILSIFFPLVIILSLTNNPPIIQMILIWLISSLILHLIIFKIFLLLTKHRGIFHTIPMGVCLGEITIVVFYNFFDFDIVFANIAGIFIVFGFLVHLTLDELVSLNALGGRVKKSFGSALKFYDKNNKIGTILLYFIIISTYVFFIPDDKKAYVDILNSIKNYKLI